MNRSENFYATDSALVEDWQESEALEFIETVVGALDERSDVYIGDKYPGLNVIDQADHTIMKENGSISIWPNSNMRISYDPVEGEYEGIVITNFETEDQYEQRTSIERILDQSEYDGQIHAAPD